MNKCVAENFMTGHHIVFDRENMKLGWSRSNCQDVSDKSGIHLAPPPSSGSQIPLPTNEQQHNNNTEAVVPAVAGRASTKASWASPLQIPTLLCIFSPFLLLLLRFLL
ncbi:aspartic proteinase-like protein 1 [Hibiscus syriacus]|uniref:aspartic proteinase-like protein 1 n=1 Tax=Hibiscus syriacus TaxID=106335 RepID=UPI00192352FC|nr:aspartic proteinase-like protein 1 [Hibiscus syriacus]